MCMLPASVFQFSNISLTKTDGTAIGRELNEKKGTDNIYFAIVSGNLLLVVLCQSKRASLR